MNSVIYAALCGAAGGVIGAGIVWGVERALGRRPGWAAGIPVVCILLALALGRASQPPVGRQVMAELDRLPPVQMIRDHYPDDYRKLTGRVEALNTSSTREEAGAAVSEVLAALLKRQRPKADGTSSYALFRMTRAEGAALRAIDPAGCFSFMEGRGAPPSLDRAMTEDLKARDGQATAQLLEQTATRPALPANAISPDALFALLSEALKTLPPADQQLAAAVFDAKREPATPDETRVMCDLNIALADTILSRPQPEAGNLVRGLWAMGGGQP